MTTNESNARKQQMNRWERKLVASLIEGDELARAEVLPDGASYITGSHGQRVLVNAEGEIIDARF